MSVEAENYLRMLKTTAGPLGFDVETNGLDWKKCHVCGWGISDGVASFYVPVRHASHNIRDIDGFEDTVARLVKEREEKGYSLIAHNAKFDMHFAQNHGVRIRKVIDTMVMGGLLDENRSSYSLKNLCKLYPEIEQKNDGELYKHLSDLFGGPANQSSMGNFWRLAGNDSVGIDYAKSDNIAVFQLYQKQFKELYAQNLDTVRQLECDLTYVLQKMERKGIRLDMPAAADLAVKIEAERIEAYQHIPLTEDLKPLNTRSSKDLYDYFTYCNIQDWPLTPKGNPSFNKLFLKQSSEGDIILQARKLDNFTNMFIEPFKDLEYNERIHTNFNQSLGEFGGTRSGRLSSSKPNMQQVPKRDKYLGPLFRKIFIADENFLLVELDYNQAEPRMFTHYSNEDVLMNGYNSEPVIDMHAVAATLMGIERDTAKSLNLGMQYAMGYKKLAFQLGISLDEAKAIHTTWKRTFKKVDTFTKEASDVAEVRGYVCTILGRRSRFSDPKFSYRAANRIVQGGCADILKWKLVALNRWIEANSYDNVIQLLLNIHDSVVFQIDKDHLHLIDEVKKILDEVQTSPFMLSVPFTTDHKPPAKDWSDATYGVAA